MTISELIESIKADNVSKFKTYSERYGITEFETTIWPSGVKCWIWKNENIVRGRKPMHIDAVIASISKTERVISYQAD